VRSLPLAPCYPSASAVRRASVCVAPWSLGLPREDTTSPDAERGRLLHAGAEAINRGGGWGEHGNYDVLHHVHAAYEADRDACRDDAGPHGSSWWVEQGVEWRPGFPDEARLVDRPVGDDVPGWYSGTADLVYVRADGVLVVADWKFGPRSRFTAERAEEHWQGWTLALGLTTALGLTAARPSDVVARFEARYVDEAGIWVDGYDITGAELEAHAGTLTELEARIRAGEGPAVGPACGDCKAKAACPAWTSLAATTREELSAGAGSLERPPQTEDEARRMLYALQALRRWEGQASGWLRSYVLTHPPIALGMGLDLAPIARESRSVLATPEALATIERVAPGAVVEEVRRKANITSIRKAARDASGEDVKSTADRKKAKDAAEAHVFAELVAAGAIRETGTVYAIGTRRASGEVYEIVDRFEDDGEEGSSNG
jgi:hypothetical protein